MITSKKIRIKGSDTQYYNETEKRWYDLKTNQIVLPNDFVIYKNPTYQIVMDEDKQYYTLFVTSSLYDVNEFSKENDTNISQLS